MSGYGLQFCFGVSLVLGLVCGNGALDSVTIDVGTGGGQYNER